MNNRKAYATTILCGLLAVYGCGSKQAAAPAAAAPKHTYTQKGSVSEMSIWPEETNFPEGPGKAEFVSYCGICHSLKYITAQPAFPRKTWEAEVHKMIEKYSAPVDSTKAAVIVDYLMAINGRP
jgi:cytochrome c5